jgi:hypothetical protein
MFRRIRPVPEDRPAFDGGAREGQPAGDPALGARHRFPHAGAFDGALKEGSMGDVSRNRDGSILSGGRVFRPAPPAFGSSPIMACAAKRKEA